MTVDGIAEEPIGVVLRSQVPIRPRAAPLLEEAPVVVEPLLLLLAAVLVLLVPELELELELLEAAVVPELPLELELELLPELLPLLLPPSDPPPLLHAGPETTATLVISRVCRRMCWLL
jgi:hypothetical protein